MSPSSTEASARCTACGQAITWAVTEANHPVPLNPPTENRFVVWWDPKGRRVTRQMAVHTSHYASCPVVNEHAAGEERR